MSNNTTNKRTSVTVDGTLIFAQVQKLDKFGKFSTNFVPLNKDETTKLTSLGLVAKEPRNENLVAELSKLGLSGQPMFTARRQPMVTDKQGNTTNIGPVKVVDSTGENTVTEFLGNGTKARLHLSVGSYLSAQTGKLEATARLNTVQIIDLVEYNAVTPIAGGYVATPSTTDTTTTSTKPTNRSDISPIS